MKKLASLTVAAFVIALLLAFTRQGFLARPAVLVQSRQAQKPGLVRCSPDWNLLEDWLEEADIPPIPGAGTYRWKISTRNDSAQFYFDQGINMYYSFHIIEAMASFKKAERFDPECSMLPWAQALSYGPNINDLGYRASPEALAAVKRSLEHLSAATPFEQALIRAMTVRYTADSADATRAQLNQDYTNLMKSVALKFPRQPDALALYADAMMLQHPWDLWNVNGTPKPWTPAIRNILETLLPMAPNHPGANHYYIHVMEPSPYAALALPSAGRLGLTNPGLSHVVHMPSHIYLRAGQYQKGVSVNESAVASYEKSIPLYAAVTGADFLYLIHNLHMQTNNAMLGGQAEKAIQSAQATAQSVSQDYLNLPAPLGSLLQYIHAAPLFAYLQFGKWSEIIASPAPADGQVYAKLLFQFARGVAFARAGDLRQANTSLLALRESMRDSSLYIPFTPFSAAIEGARVAEGILDGVIQEEQGRLMEAIRLFKKAELTETGMVYNEPRDWLISPRHYLARALIKAKKWKEAEQVCRADLAYNQENGWSLFGLYKSLAGQGKTTAAQAAEARYKKAFGKTGIVIEQPAF